MSAGISNVGEPVDDTDAVSKGYMSSKIPKKLEDSYSVAQFRIQDVG